MTEEALHRILCDHTTVCMSGVHSNPASGMRGCPRGKALTLAWPTSKNQRGSPSFKPGKHFLPKAKKPQGSSGSWDMWFYQERNKPFEDIKSLEAGRRLDTLGSLELHTTAEDRHVRGRSNTHDRKVGLKDLWVPHPRNPEAELDSTIRQRSLAPPQERLDRPPGL